MRKKRAAGDANLGKTPGHRRTPDPMLSSFFAIVAAFTTVPTAPRGSVARGAPVMSLDRRQALRLSLGSAVLAGVPLASHATATADGGNQELDNSAMRFNNKNLGGITDYKGADDTEAAMAKIAQRNREAQEEQERRRLAQFRSKTQAEVDAEIEAEKAKSKNLILGIAGGGPLLSGVFIVPNLRRLGIKIASGGADRGYDSVPVSSPPNTASVAHVSRCSRPTQVRVRGLTGAQARRQARRQEGGEGRGGPLCKQPVQVAPL